MCWEVLTFAPPWLLMLCTHRVTHRTSSNRSPGTDGESLRQLDDVLDRDVPFAALEATDVVTVQRCSFREFLLGVAASFPQGANGSSEEGFG